MEAASLAISICAFVLAAAAFGWTVYEWSRSGARLKVEVTSFAVMHPITGQDWMIAFDVSNAGRTMTSVTTVGFQRADGGGVLVTSAPALGENPLPRRLEPGDSFTYPVRVEELLESCEKGGIDFRRLVPYANTGHGQFKGAWKKVALDVVSHRAN
jgi:hypothetical protein